MNVQFTSYSWRNQQNKETGTKAEAHMDIKAHIAATRFGLGHAHDFDVPSASKSALLTQVQNAHSSSTASNAEALISDILSFQFSARSAAMAGEVLPPEKRAVFNQSFRQSVNDRLALSVESEAPFRERLVQFWSNHFAIDAKSLVVRALAPDYENAAIATYVGGRFADLLKSALLHPAMLIYLDQVNSIGPNSIAGQRGREARELKGKKAGLNENLAREILELHTLGVNGGYSQGDIEELARAMTGHTIAHYSRQRDAKEGSAGKPLGRAIFIPQLHEPGERRLLGQRYPDTGAGQFLGMLDALAVHPATATFLATKLARHFVADAPPAQLVKSMATAYLGSKGDLMALYAAMLDAEESWRAEPLKFKSPWDWTVSACRLISNRAHERIVAHKFVQDLGQSIWQPGSPAGFGDQFTHWASPDGLVRRVGAAERLAGRAGQDPLSADAIDALFPANMLSVQSRSVLLAAESPRSQWAIALSLPEFQRR